MSIVSYTGGRIFTTRLPVWAWVLALLWPLAAGPGWAGDERAGAPAAEETMTPPSPFLRDAQFNAALHLFQRYRDRRDVSDQRYFTNLSHATGQVSLNFESGWLNDMAGLDFGVFGVYDAYNNGAPDHRGAPDHEMNFFPWRDPWRPDWNRRQAKDGGSVYQALVKLKAGPAWARAGWFQPKGPGILGVNWSFLPGTYQGIEGGADFGRLSLAGAWVERYKAPWFTRTYGFKKNDGVTEVDYAWSLGARYAAENGLTLEAAYGQSQDYLWNAHLKAGYELALAGEDRLALAWHAYFMNDLVWDGPANDNFSGLAMQHYLAGRWDTGPWTLNLDFTYTLAPNDRPGNNAPAGNVGYFAYRPVSRYGGANGAYAPWWDLRSDWNHDQEKAVFVKAGRSLDDLGLTGVWAGLSGAYGWGGTSSAYAEKLCERALGLDLRYTLPADDGWLAGAVLALHFTRYDNMTDIPSWAFSGNAFQDERDVRLSLSIPLTR